MEYRRIFDTIPEAFDRWRPRYCPEVFADIIAAANLGSDASALEIGPGTGQATEPILKTGCHYLGIELGEHLAAFMAEKFKSYANLRLINGDFVTHDFGRERFDLILSAATIQWIDEEIAFPRSFELLKSGGVLAMMRIVSDYRSSNASLYHEIQAVYDRYFHPEMPYTRKFTYSNAINYGFVRCEHREYASSRTFTADEYVQYIHTHCDHLTLKDPDRERFFDGIRGAILNAGGQIVLNDRILLDLARKP